MIHRRSVSVLAYVPVRRPACPNAASSGLCPCRVAAKSEFSLEKSVQFVPAEVGRLFPLGLKQAEIPPYGQDGQNASVSYSIVPLKKWVSSILRSSKSAIFSYIRSLIVIMGRFVLCKSRPGAASKGYTIFE